MGAEMRGRVKRPRYEGREWAPSKSTGTCNLPTSIGGTASSSSSSPQPSPPPAPWSSMSISCTSSLSGYGRNDRDTGRYRAEMDSLEIDEEEPGSVDRAINRRKIITLSDGDDGSSSDMPEVQIEAHAKRGGPAWHKNSTMTTRSCGSRESPAAACRLSRTAR